MSKNKRMVETIIQKGFDKAKTATETFPRPSSGAKGTSPGVKPSYTSILRGPGTVTRKSTWQGSVIADSLVQKRVLFDPGGMKDFESGELGIDELENEYKDLSVFMESALYIMSQECIRMESFSESNPY